MRKIIYLLALGAIGAGLAAYAAPLPSRAKAQPGEVVPEPEARR
ncbi:hypothetical protein ABC347_06970 [Sphingomonas sp. 1P06PA]